MNGDSKTLVKVVPDAPIVGAVTRAITVSEEYTKMSVPVRAAADHSGGKPTDAAPVAFWIPSHLLLALPVSARQPN